jgi:Rrf2 family protein
MDLTLSRAGDYALRAAVCLANAWGDGGYVTIAQVVENMNLPASYTPQILGMLARAGVAESRPGRGGGYRLARSPTEISILTVVESAEGTLGNVSCPLSGGPCRWDDACAVHPTWSEVTASVRAVLERTTLERVAREDRELGVSRRRRGGMGTGGTVTPR